MLKIIEPKNVNNTKDIWKISHGKTGEITKKDHDWLLRNCYVAQGYPLNTNEGKKQGKLFASIKKGDYFYLVRDSRIILLGQFDADAAQPVSPILTSIPTWSMRHYSVIKDISSDSYPSSNVSGTEYWKPQGYSTVTRVPSKDLTEFEKKILTPAFDMFLKDFGIVVHHHDDPDHAIKGVNMHQPALNQIMYGPPGTGKTFNTVEAALSILEKTAIPEGDFEAQKKRFDAFKEGGQIEFITFHQSFSYEDFVEGLRADAVDGSISYKIKDGVFKQIAMLALFSKLDHTTIKQVAFPDVYYQFLTIVKNTLPYSLQTKTSKKLLITKVSDKDTLHVSHEGSSVIHRVGKDRLKKLYDAYPTIEIFSAIENIKEAVEKVIGGSNVTVYWAVLNYILQLQKNMIDEHIVDGNDISGFEDWTYEEKKSRVLNSDVAEFKLLGSPYVLIIDEINRGNMSRILGELITLIEDSKRFGSAESLEVRLPYSHELFKVPNNLYIIGTMNTTDRSLSMIDTALRRRFNFTEKMPQPELLKNKTIEGINLESLLNTINSRIEALYDREHTIGHSFFMKLKNDSPIKDLASIFENNILPLLEEYFFEDWDKIIKVLGNSGIYTTKSFKNLGFEPLGKTYQRNLELLKESQTYIKIYSEVIKVDTND